MSYSGYVHVKVERIIRQTDEAFLLQIESEEIWVPASQIADADSYEVGDENITISMTEWIAKQKGIEYEES